MPLAAANGVPGALSDGRLPMVVGVLLLAALLWGMTRKSGDRTLPMIAAAFLLAIAGLEAANPLFGSGSSTARYLRWTCVFLEGFCIIRLLGVAIFRVTLPAARMTLPRIVEEVVVATAAVVWSFIWLRENGVNVAGLVATSAVVTAVIGLSLQDTLGNILGGVAIQFDQSIRVGDWIQVDDLVGRVVEIRWRHTSLETRDWETVVIPNGVLVKNRFLVLGRRQGQPVQLRRTVRFNVDYRVPPSQVMEVVSRALQNARIRAVATEPPPNCLLLSFEHSFGCYAARYWLTDLTGDDAVDSEVRTHVYFALRRAGIGLSIPAQAVFLTQETPERKSDKAAKEIEERLHALRSVELFTGLHLEELQGLAARLQSSPFRSGEIIARQGETADCLFILVSGTADVLVSSVAGDASRVAELAPGSFFGEMGLMTGEPRSATVRAATDVVCLRLEKAAFREVLLARPALAEEIAQVLARRRAELDTVLQTLDADARAARLSEARGDILARVRKFLSLPGTTEGGPP